MPPRCRHRLAAVTHGKLKNVICNFVMSVISLTGRLTNWASITSTPKPCFNIRTVFPGMGFPLLSRTSYLYNGNTYTVRYLEKFPHVSYARLFLPECRYCVALITGGQTTTTFWWSVADLFDKPFRVWTITLTTPLSVYLYSVAPKHPYPLSDSKNF